MEERMTSNVKKGSDACAGDAKFRDTLLNHSKEADYVSDELDRIKIVFKNDAGGTKRKAVIDYIASVDWSKLKYLEKAASEGDGVQPVMG
jgi:hypothetical protein